MNAIVKPTAALNGTINPLSSKNYTTRYLLAAALSKEPSVIYYPAHSEDSDAMRRCIAKLGAMLKEDHEKMEITGFGPDPKAVESLDVGNAGAVLRFLLSTASLLPQVTFVNTYPDSLGKRPHDDLLKALQEMGVQVESNGGKLPITLRGGHPRGGDIRISGSVSSQFLSSLLFLAPLLEEDSTISVLNDLKSKPLITQTLEVLREAGIEVEASEDLMSYRVPGRQAYRGRKYIVPGDYPGTAAVLAAGAVTHSHLRIPRLQVESKQGEKAVVDVLRQMGANIQHENDTVELWGNQQLNAIEYDGDQATDAVLAMVSAAVFAKGTSRFYNVENLRYKECDRITDFCTELKKAGADVEERRSEIIVHGKPEGVNGGVEINPHYDHRVIMALTVVGLRSRQGLTIRDAHHVAKSYPQFFEHMQQLGADITLD
jgi:3-phosphoshikimate 1-carboxyvinyltransferase